MLAGLLHRREMTCLSYCSHVSIFSSSAQAFRFRRNFALRNNRFVHFFHVLLLGERKRKSHVCCMNVCFANIESTMISTISKRGAEQEAPASLNTLEQLRVLGALHYKSAALERT